MMTPIELCNTSQGDETKTVCEDVSSLQRHVWLCWWKLFAYSGAYLQKYAFAYNLTMQV